ncbi:MAG: hypothetical protein IEMM0002_0145 [bacterium]|nr:MAG: hypothetical protein IEMM0002_0145 [bacterium]
MSNKPVKNPVIIIQARIGSTRLPGKSMIKLAGRPLIDWVIEGAGEVRNTKSIVVATTSRDEDSRLADHVRELGVKEVFRGDAEDVLGRFYHAAMEVNADPVIRLCGDNPLAAAEYLDEMITRHIEREADFTYNRSKIPLGVTGEVISMRALEKIHREAGKPHQREHVTPYLLENPESFVIQTTDAPEWMRGDFRMTVDEERDLMMFEMLFKAVTGKKMKVDFKNAMDVMRLHPEIAALNASVKQKDWRLEGFFYRLVNNR